MFNTGQFILEVKKRPCLWNVKDSANNDRQQKLKAFKEIAQLLNASNQLYSLSTRNITVNDLQRKWKHLRDYYTRERKRGFKYRDNDGESDNIDTKNSSSTRKKRKSPLLDMLQFLDANRGFEFVELTIEQLAAEENFSLEIKGGEEKEHSDKERPLARKKQKVNEETQLIKLNEDTEESLEKHFLKSLMPIIKKMSAKEKDNFRFQIMSSVAKSIGKYNKTAASEDVVQSPTTPQEEHPSFGIDEQGNKTTTEIRKHNTIHKSYEAEEENTPSKFTEVIHKRDEYSIYGEYVANKLRNIPDSQARHTAEYHINGILYQAEMGHYDKVSIDTAKNSTQTQTSQSNTKNTTLTESREDLVLECQEEMENDIVSLAIVKSEVIQLE